MSFLPRINFPQREFEPVNFTPDSVKTPVCPNYQIIDIAAEFAGYEINPDKFCGWEGEPIDIYSPLSGRKGGDYEPCVTCVRVAHNLESQINIASTRPKIPDGSTPIGMLTREDIGSYLVQQKIVEGHNQAVARMRRATFENCTTGKENHHIHAVTSPDEITEGEAIENAGLFLEGLKQITGETTFLYHFQLPANCPQRPRGFFSGTIS